MKKSTGLLTFEDTNRIRHEKAVEEAQARNRKEDFRKRQEDAIIQKYKKEIIAKWSGYIQTKIRENLHSRNPVVISVRVPNQEDFDIVYFVKGLIEYFTLDLRFPLQTNTRFPHQVLKCVYRNYDNCWIVREYIIKKPWYKFWSLDNKYYRPYEYVVDVSLNFGGYNKHDKSTHYHCYLFRGCYLRLGNNLSNSRR